MNQRERNNPNPYFVILIIITKHNLKQRLAKNNIHKHLPFFKDNNVHKYRTYQPPLKTSGLPFSATSASFLPRFFSNPLIPVVSAERINPPPPPPLSAPGLLSLFQSQLPSPRTRQNASPYPAPCVRGKSRIRCLYSGVAAFFFFFFFKLVRPEIVVVGVTGHVSADRDGLRFRFLNKENLAVAISPVVRNRPNSTRLVFIRRILSRVWVVGKGNKSSSGVRFYRDSLCVERFTGRT